MGRGCVISEIRMRLRWRRRSTECPCADGRFVILKKGQDYIAETRRSRGVRRDSLAGVLFCNIEKEFKITSRRRGGRGASAGSRLHRGDAEAGAGIRLHRGDAEIAEAGAGSRLHRGDAEIAEAGAGSRLHRGDAEVAEAGAGSRLHRGDAEVAEAGAGSRLHRGDAETGAGSRLAWHFHLKTWFRLPPRSLHLRVVSFLLQSKIVKLCGPRRLLVPWRVSTIGGVNPKKENYADSKDAWTGGDGGGELRAG